MIDDELTALRHAKRLGDVDSYLDGLGRAAAKDAAPDYVVVAERAIALVSAANAPKSGVQNKLRRNPDYKATQPDLFDATGSAHQLVMQLAFLEYEIDGEIVSRDALPERLDLVARLEKKRREEGDAWEKEEDRARTHKWEAWKDANILAVVFDRLQPMAAE